MFCPSCGFELNQKMNFCKRCGAPMNSAGNTVEIQLPKQPILGMVFFTVAFAFAGLLMIMVAFSEFSSRSLPEKFLTITFLGSLFFIFGIAGLLIWQISRLVSTYQDAVRQTIQKARLEPVVAAPPAIPQASHINNPVVSEPVPASVTEHTTRQMASQPRVSLAKE